MGFLATTTSISDLLPNYLVSNTLTSDTAGASIFSRHIDRAEGLVMSAITRKYNPAALTTTTYPPVLRQWAEDIACYFAIRGASTQDSGKINRNIEEFKPSYDFVMEILRGDAEFTLAYTDGSLVPSRSSSMIVSSSQSFAPITNLDDETAWTVDPDLLDDIEGDRG